MKIIDAHHHYWDLEANYHPWLRDEPMIPFRYGDYTAIRQRFMPDEYDRVSQQWDVIGTVTMEGEWDPSDTTGEATWMQSLADSTGKPAAHVAQAWLDSNDIGDVLDYYQSLQIVKSVRHKPRYNPAPGGPPGQMMDKAFREGFARLADAQLHFDLQTPWWHLQEAVDLAKTAPETAIILNHCGLPSDRSDEGLAGWRAALQHFSTVPNSYIKISGIGLLDTEWRLDDNLEIIKFCIDTFGPERSMFASNFPVDGLCGSFDTLYSGYRDAIAAQTAEFQESLFFRTAATVYDIKLPDDEGSGGV